MYDSVHVACSDNNLHCLRDAGREGLLTCKEDRVAGYEEQCGEQQSERGIVYGLNSQESGNVDRSERCHRDQ